MVDHYRKDSNNGITSPNPDAPKDVLQHITKHRGMKTPYTSVSEDSNSIMHFDGVLYKTTSSIITVDGHDFKTHKQVLAHLQNIQLTAVRKEKILVNRAIANCSRAKEALVDWNFNLKSVDRKDHISVCYSLIQKYFSKV